MSRNAESGCGRGEKLVCKGNPFHSQFPRPLSKLSPICKGKRVHNATQNNVQYTHSEKNILSYLLYSPKLNSETHCFTSYQIQFTQPNNTAILENFTLYYIDVATLLTHTPYPYLYPYTRNTTVRVTFTIIQCNTKVPGTPRRCAIRMSGASQPIVTQYNVKIHQKKTRLIVIVRKNAN